MENNHTVVEDLLRRLQEVPGDAFLIRIGETWTKRLVVGNDGGVWSTADEGKTWMDHNTDLAITQFYAGSVHFTDPDVAIGGSQDN
ncbi:MAG: hypothetical protein HGA28_08155, partial [Anaerolineaceae bacterium]|nr:hypothetical protein [Anaerolineaceae bacterium]